MPKKYVVTGKIGSGKSSFINILKELQKYEFRSADDDAKAIINENICSIQSIVYDIYGEDIDYKELFFKDKILKEKIEALVHKNLYEYYKDLKNVKDTFFEIPLYFESKNIADRVGFIPDKIIYIDVENGIRHKRLMDNRNMTIQQILEREKYFKSDDYSKDHADLIIKNNDDYDSLKERTLKYFA